MNRKEKKNFEIAWIFAEYEDGKAVSAIAAEMDRSEAFVYAKLKQKPEKYDEIKKIREEKYNRRLNRIRGLGDQIVLEYLEKLSADKEKAFEKIESVNRIARDYANRVQLAEGKATENIGVGGLNRPFNVLITKTYASKDKDKGSDD